MLSSEIDEETSAPNSQYDNDGNYIAELEMDTNTDPNTLIIHLENEVSYRLNMAKVGHKTGYQASFPDSAQPDTKYLTSISNTEPVVNEGNKVEFTVQVRDKYHNPISDRKVSVQPPHDSDVDQVEKLSAADGKVTFTYEAPNVDSDTTENVKIKIDGLNGNAVRVEFQVTVQETD